MATISSRHLQRQSWHNRWKFYSKEIITEGSSLAIGYRRIVGVETAWHPRQDRMLVSESFDNHERLVLEGIAPMESTPTKSAARRPHGRVPLSPMGAVLLAILFGVCGGYLDLGVIVFKRFCLNPEGSFRSARDFPWTVPVSHAVLLVIPGVVVAAVNRLRPKLVSLNVASWVFATLAIWSALLRMPMYGAC